MYSVFWFIPLLFCSSRGRLWLAFPSWAHLNFPGMGTDNKGIGTLRTFAAKCSHRVLGRFAQSVQKCLLSVPELAAEGDSSVPGGALDHGNIPIFSASSALASVSCLNFRSEVSWRAQGCTKMLEELCHPRAPHWYVSSAHCTSPLCFAGKTWNYSTEVNKFEKCGLFCLKNVFCWVEGGKGSCPVGMSRHPWALQVRIGREVRSRQGASLNSWQNTISSRSFGCWPKYIQKYWKPAISQAGIPEKRKVAEPCHCSARVCIFC